MESSDPDLHSSNANGPQARGYSRTAEQRQGLLCGVVDFFQNGSDLLGAPKTQLLEARPSFR